MRIEGVSSYFYNDSSQWTAGRTPGLKMPQSEGQYGPGVIVEISQQARDYQNKGLSLNETQSVAATEKTQGCQTCKNRKYVDESSDPSVSFQTPQHISPSQSSSRVLSHEREHVANEQEKAEKEDRKIVSQTVSLSTSVCPECGRIYVSGGVTRTITKNDEKQESGAQETPDSKAQ
ncbi:MAG: hypothetical protein LBH16_08125 [Treponema sp.]|nr:hypothetical protein [Treponema sp.]